MGNAVSDCNGKPTLDVHEAVTSPRNDRSLHTTPGSDDKPTLDAHVEALAPQNDRSLNVTPVSDDKPTLDAHEGSMAPQKDRSLDVSRVCDALEPFDERCQPAVHMLICALDYRKTKFPLTCTVDGDNMLNLASFCNVKTIRKVFDEEATRPNVITAIENVGSGCQPGDFFVFYYAGHGSTLKDNDGDETDGKDEAYCLVDEDGQTSCKTWLRDDDFAKAVSSSVKRGTNILIISDCCHSGTIADLTRPEWNGHKAISISGCTDAQTSGDTGRGGIFTHSMLLAIEKLNKKEQYRYSVQDLYDATLKKDDKTFNSVQDITLQTVPWLSSNLMEWPLIPPQSYKAPYRTPLQQFAEAAAEALHLPVILGSKECAGDGKVDDDKAAAPEVVTRKTCGCISLRESRRRFGVHG